MTVASPNASTDALTRLRIPRGEGVPRRSFFGRLIRFLFVMVVVVVLLAGGTFLAQARGWLPNMDRLLESVRPKPEVRVSIVSVETGRSADATVVATGYLKSRQQARIGARRRGELSSSTSKKAAKSKRMMFWLCSNMPNWMRLWRPSRRWRLDPAASCWSRT